VSNLISPENSPNLRISVTGLGSERLVELLGILPYPLEDSDVAIFCVSALDGFSAGVIENWEKARALYVPSIVAIGDLEKSEIDFEDMSAIVGKTLDPVLTPYLVLHSDEGFPTAVISLETQFITDYTLGLRKEIPSEIEHRELIAEFRAEYFEQMESAGEDAFINALIFPALPIALHLKLGLSEIDEWLRKIPTSR